jgi:hypothetical protein
MSWNVKELLNHHCYDFETIEYKYGIFDSFVDVTYIITINNIEKVIDKLKLFTPTSKIIIVKNKTYKNCNKLLYQQDSHHDLTNANMNIMYHSIQNNYNNILILEDDFEFELHKINTYSVNHIYNIKTFFDKKKDESFIYNLGPMPILFQPFLIDKYHYKGIKLLSTHSLLYSRNVQHKIFDFMSRHNFQYKYSKYYDIFLTTFYTNYFYYTPLCYQTNQNYKKGKFYSIPFYMQFIHFNETISHFHTKLVNLHIITNNQYKLWFIFFIVFNYIIFIVFILILLFIIINIINIILYKDKNILKITKKQ